MKTGASARSQRYSAQPHFSIGDHAYFPTAQNAHERPAELFGKEIALGDSIFCLKTVANLVVDTNTSRTIWLVRHHLVP